MILEWHTLGDLIDVVYDALKPIYGDEVSSVIVAMLATAQLGEDA